MSGREKPDKYRWPDVVAAIVAMYHSGQPVRSFYLALFFIVIVMILLRHH